MSSSKTKNLKLSLQENQNITLRKPNLDEKLLQTSFVTCQYNCHYDLTNQPCIGACSILSKQWSREIVDLTPAAIAPRH